MKGAGAKLVQFLSMLALQRERPRGALGTLHAGGQAIAFDRVRKVVEHGLDAPCGSCSPSSTRSRSRSRPSARSTARARTTERGSRSRSSTPGWPRRSRATCAAWGSSARSWGSLAPGVDAGALLAEVRERISDELDYELEAQHQRRLQRRFRGHPHVLVSRVHTDISTRRVLVTDYVEGLQAQEIERLPEAERDRVGEVVFRFYLGLAWRDGIVAGDPHADNCVLCPDGRVGLLDLGLLRDLELDDVEAERGTMQAIAGADAAGVHAALERLGYLPEPDAVEPDALLEHLATAGAWLLAPGFCRLGPDDVDRVLQLGYPPRSPRFAQMRRMSLPQATLLLRRMELQVLSVLGDLRAGADWGALAAEHHAGATPSTVLGREDHAFFARRAL
jgi:ABC1 atypical kinase-like domain